MSKKDLITQVDRITATRRFFALKTYHDVGISSLYRYPEQSETHRDRKKDFSKDGHVCDARMFPPVDRCVRWRRSKFKDLTAEFAKISSTGRPEVRLNKFRANSGGPPGGGFAMHGRETHPENEEAVVK